MPQNSTPPTIPRRTHLIVNGVVGVVGLISIFLINQPSADCYTGLFIGGCESIPYLMTWFITLYVVSYALATTLLRKFYHSIRWGKERPWLGSASVYLAGFIVALPILWVLVSLVSYASTLL